MNVTWLGKVLEHMKPRIRCPNTFKNVSPALYVYLNLDTCLYTVWHWDSDGFAKCGNVISKKPVMLNSIEGGSK